MIVQQVAKNVYRGRLAVGAGNADQSQHAGGETECRRRRNGDGAAAFPHDESGKLRCAGILDHCCDRAARACLAEIGMPIEQGSAYRNEQPARRDMAAMIGNITDLVGKTSARLDEQPSRAQGAGYRPEIHRTHGSATTRTLERAACTTPASGDELTTRPVPKMRTRNPARWRVRAASRRESPSTSGTSRGESDAVSAFATSGMVNRTGPASGTGCDSASASGSSSHPGIGSTTSGSISASAIKAESAPAPDEAASVERSIEAPLAARAATTAARKAGAAVCPP